ncbi:MAG: hypothetical protein KC502_02725 [Myxococcales bacterium]|nr:hypothetical protein [Myxococcales bacterium]
MNRPLAARPRALSWALTVLLLPVLVGGCTSAITQLQRGRVLKPLEFEINAGMSLPLSGKAIQAAIEAEEELAKQVQSSPADGSGVTEDDARQLTKVAAAVLLFMPAPTQELSLRTGVGLGFDVGLRLSGPRAQLDAKYQVLAAESHGVDLGVSLAFARHSSPAESLWKGATDAAESLKILDYARSDVTLSVIASRDVGPWFSIWAALAYSRSDVTIDSQLIGVAAEAGVDASALAVSEAMQQVGGQFGFRIGYRYVYLMVEFSVMHVDFEPMILGEKTDLSGLMFTPTFALQVTF